MYSYHFSAVKQGSPPECSAFPSVLNFQSPYSGKHLFHQGPTTVQITPGCRQPHQKMFYRKDNRCERLYPQKLSYNLNPWSKHAQVIYLHDWGLGQEENFVNNDIQLTPNVSIIHNFIVLLALKTKIYGGCWHSFHISCMYLKWAHESLVHSHHTTSIVIVTTIVGRWE